MALAGTDSPVHQATELDGVAALRAIRAANPAAKLIIFTAFDTDERILSAVQAGARGFAFNADLATLVKFLDIGTQVA